MKLKSIILSVVACLSLAASAQPVQQQEEWEWYLDQVVNDVFVGRNDFEYYYLPSASDMEQQRNKGEVTYFLNSPEGLSAKKTCNLIDRIMASYDDIKAMGTWTDANTIYWKEFRFEKNKFRFNVKREALDDGTYYVSVVETSNYYKSLGKKNQEETKDKQEAKPKSRKSKEEKSTRRSTRDRRPVTQDDVDAADDEVVAVADALAPTDDADDVADKPVMSEADRRRSARKSEEERRQQERLEKRRAQEEQRAQEKAQKEADKQRRAEEKKMKEDEKRQKREADKQRREQERQAREQERRDKKESASRSTVAPAAPVESKYHFDDVALWLSEKYDFTQVAGDDASCTMFSTAVKDVEMAKLAIKNALKGSNARMAVPWRLNSETGEVETGYFVDDHVLVFAVGKNDDGHVTLSVTEVSGEDFELFKQGVK